MAHGETDTRFAEARETMVGMKRRGLIAGAAAMAAGLLAAQPAEHALAGGTTGGPLIIGANGSNANTSTAETDLNVSGGGFGFIVTNSSPTSIGVGGVAPAIGLYGVANATNGLGVSAFAASGSGVQGISYTGYGVAGYGEQNGSTGVIGSAGGTNGTGVLGTASGANGAGVVGTVTGSGATNGFAAVVGYATAATSTSFGVFGSSLGSYGVYGYGASNPGVYGLSPTSFGVRGDSRSSTGVGGLGASIGVYGAGGRNAIGTGDGTGVYGVGSGAGAGVYGIGVDNGSSGVFGQSDAPGGYGVQGKASGGHGIYGATSAGAGYAGVYGFASTAGTYGIAGGAGGAGAYAALFVGPVVVNGSFTVVDPTQKHGAIAHPDGSHRLLYSMESPESWLEDFGRAQLSGGRAEVKLDVDFAAVIQPNEYHVFLTPYDDTRTLHVTNQSGTGFVVQESQGGTSNASFSYRVVARPKTTNHAERLARVELPHAVVPSGEKVVAPAKPKIEPGPSEPMPVVPKAPAPVKRADLPGQP